MSGTPARSSRMNTRRSAPAGLAMRDMRPCATGLRRKATSLCPCSIMSATKRPRPRRWRASSLRLTRAPMPCAVTLSLLRRHDVAIVVEIVLGQPEPEIRFGEELLPGRIDLLEVLALGGELVVGFERRLVAGVEDRTRELLKLHAGCHQAAQRLRILGVVLRHQHDILLGTGGVERILVELRQGLVALRVDQERDHGRAFPPAGIVVELGDLMEAELLVVVGADPLRGVDGPALERGIDVGGRDLLRHHAELGENGAAEPADAELEALEVVDAVDLLAVEAAHLHADIAAGNL